ncbi:MAG: aldehyde ferredoxin oxidoreductase C-terminal domain-containing protein, partial [Desulfobacterales bacterium]
MLSEGIHSFKHKKQKTCGEPCLAVCKKMHGEYKKDYEPYQVMGPLSGIFDQRAAEKLNHHADMYGFDAISVGGVISWLMECLYKRYLTPKELGVKQIPVFSPKGLNVTSDSEHNAEIGMALLDSIVQKRRPQICLPAFKRERQKNSGFFCCKCLRGCASLL